MNTLGDIVRQYGAAYLARYGEQMLPSQAAALRAIEACRTEALGGRVYRCEECQSVHYSYHSCRNRHCPQCQHDAAQQWLARQEALLLPVPYFLITFTLPSGLRDVAYRHQRLLYDAFFRASAAALQQLARDERFVGGQIALLGVLQTWTRDVRYHPHIHYLVPGGGLSEDGQSWLASKAEFFVHVKPLSRLFRAKLQAALRESAVYPEIEPQVWEQDWVVDCRSVGSGRAALKEMAPYIFRIALSNNRIVRVADGEVTFSYRLGETGERRECTMEAVAFLHRYLQHILPKGFVKVRYYGLFRVGARRALARLRGRLWLQAGLARLEALLEETTERREVRELRCPRCGAVLRLERELSRVRAPPQRERQG
jgi:putative transposase/transposase-like zinc-binding protein